MPIRNATRHKLIARAKRLARAAVKCTGLAANASGPTSESANLTEIKLAVIGSLAKGLARKIRWQIDGPQQLVAVQASLDDLTAIEKSVPTVVMIADVPRLRTSTDVSEYQARLTQALETFSSDRRRLVVWNSIPAACFAGDEHGDVNAQAIAALNDRMFDVCAELGAGHVDMSGKFNRWGHDAFITDGGTRAISRSGLQAMAQANAKVIDRWRPLQDLNRIVAPELRGDAFDGVAQLDAADADGVLADSLRVVALPPFVRYRADRVQADKLCRGIVSSEEGPDVQLQFPLQWNQAGPNRSWQSCLLATDFLQYMAATFEETGNLDYLATAEELLFSWQQANPPGAAMMHRSWHEGTATKRLMNLLAYLPWYVKWHQVKRQGALDVSPRAGGLLQIVTLIQQHASLLMMPQMAIGDGNHAVRQCLALLSAAVALPDFADAEKWRRAALSRLQLHLQETLAPDGVWLEHSPTYHFYVLGMLLLMLAILERAETGEPAPEFLTDAASSMLPFAAHVLLPDTTVPPIGDSMQKKWGYQRYLQTIEQLSGGAQYLYAASGGEIGVPPTELDGIFEPSGWMIMRDRRLSASGEGTYINFHATMHSLRHKQADDLSFIVYARKRDWIVDAGKYNYEHADAFRNHFRNDVAAHNSYTVDGRSYELRGGSDHGGVGIRATLSTPDIAAAVGVNEYYRGARVKRTIVFVRDRGLVVLIDELHASSEAMWRSHLHLAHDLRVIQDDVRVTGHAPDGSGCIDILTDAQVFSKPEIVIGRTDPPLGWASPKWGEKVPAPVLVFEAQRKSAMAVTALLIRGDHEAPLRSVVPIDVSPRAGRFEIRIGEVTGALDVQWMPTFDVQWMG